MIPFVDLNAQYLSIKDEIENAIHACVVEGNFIRGRKVTEFENDFATYLGSDHCIGCGNGTDALEIILKSLGVGSGDEVIVPALSWIATAECVNNVGAEPVFVDVNPFNYTIDINRIEEKITSRTKAIIPVHLYGGPADLEGISEIAEKHGLYIVEDCAQAHGAEFKGKKIGTFGIASAFSFFPSKNLGAFGDAGAIVTNDKKIADNARMVSNHGQLKVRHNHNVIGRNSRLDTIQASILGIKLKHLDDWNLKRISAASFYKSRLLSNKKLIIPIEEKDRKHVYHLFVIRLQNRDSLIEILNKNGVATGIHYPGALPFLEAYRYKKHSVEDFPVASKLTREVLSLPIYPEITESQIDIICNIINENS
jgi:dTDP-4-amino-4,6-dideoxygalactose transaminase